MATSITEDPINTVRVGVEVEDNTREIGNFSFRMAPDVAIGLVTVAQLVLLAEALYNNIQPILTGTIVKVNIALGLLPSGVNPSGDIAFQSRDDKARVTLLCDDKDESAVTFPTPGTDIFDFDQETVLLQQPDFVAAIGAIIGPTSDGTHNWGFVNEDGGANAVVLNGYRTRARGKFGTRPV